jgi:hypothetical protein
VPVCFGGVEQQGTFDQVNSGGGVDMLTIREALCFIGRGYIPPSV